MAPMWEAMGRPLLPQLAKAFAAQLKAAIEQAAGAVPAELYRQRRSLWAMIRAWLGKLFGKGEQTA